MKLLLLLCMLLGGTSALLTGPGTQANQDPAEELRRTLSEVGLELDLERQLMRFPVDVLVREELLEYLLIGPRGQAHESLFHTELRPSLINAALLALGATPGKNARWEPIEPPPTEEELRAGAPAHRVYPPEGDGFYLYVAWREGEELYHYRVEDVLQNLSNGRSMRRHRWVFLGSRFAPLKEGEPEVFLADYEENLINLAFFQQGNTLLTAALPECVQQTIWTANPWLLPPKDAKVELIFARERLAGIPDEWRDSLPHVERSE